MDEDDSISGNFSVVNGEIDPATQFPFADSDGLFYIETIPISETKYKTMSGFDNFYLWHKRLSHTPRQAIKDTIPHLKGLQELEGLRMNREMDCESCMIGKAKLQPYPKSKEHAKRPLERVYMDIMSLNVTSIEGYDYALVAQWSRMMCQCIDGYTALRPRMKPILPCANGLAILSISEIVTGLR
jgi:hypothetical protein